MDVYDPSLGGAQIHDLNPGITQNGLFWTAVVSPDSVTFDLNAGTARLHVQDIHLKDYHDIPNALGLVEGGPRPLPATLSFNVQWNLAGAPVHFDNSDQHFRGEFRASPDASAAQMEWSARVGQLQFESAGMETSASSYAELGHEQNGSFYKT